MQLCFTSLTPTLPHWLQRDKVRRRLTWSLFLLRRLPMSAIVGCLCNALLLRRLEIFCFWYNAYFFGDQKYERSQFSQAGLTFTISSEGTMIHIVGMGHDAFRHTRAC